MKVSAFEPHEVQSAVRNVLDFRRDRDLGRPVMPRSGRTRVLHRRSRLAGGHAGDEFESQRRLPLIPFGSEYRQPALQDS